MPRKAYSMPVSLLQYEARLPRSRDQDALEQLIEFSLTQRAWGLITHTTQPAASAELRRIRRRLEAIRRHRQLQVREEKQKRAIRELSEENLFSRREARFLWSLYWTTSPAEALRRAPLAGWRNVLERCVATPPRFLGANARALRAGLLFLRRKGAWGILWGRQARSSTPFRPGTRGNRFVEGIGEVISK